MPNVVSIFICLGPERPQTLFGLTCCQDIESFVNTSDQRENLYTLSIFHEDSRKPDLYSSRNFLSPVPVQLQFELTCGRKNESLENVFD